jgi:hypothetical protein
VIIQLHTPRPIALIVRLTALTQPRGFRPGSLEPDGAAVVIGS